MGDAETWWTGASLRTPRGRYAHAEISQKTNFRRPPGLVGEALSDPTGAPTRPRPDPRS